MAMRPATSLARLSMSANLDMSPNLENRLNHLAFKVRVGDAGRSAISPASCKLRVNLQGLLDGQRIMRRCHVMRCQQQHAALDAFLREQAAYQKAVFAVSIEKLDQRPEGIADALDTVLQSRLLSPAH